MKGNHHKDLARHRMEKAARNLSKARQSFQLGFYDEAVAKSYYAILTAIRSLLAVKHLDSHRHEGVIKLFHLHFVKTKLFPQRFNSIIARLKKLREDADYGDYVTFSEESAQTEIHHAEEFLKKADGLLAALLTNERD